MTELTFLAQYGLAGVAIALVIALIYIVREFSKSSKAQEKEFMDFIGNHIEHHTRANQRLADMIESLMRWLDKNNKK